MKLIFWTNIYDGGLGYLEHNTSLQNLSKTQEMYFMSNGNKCVEMATSLYNGDIIDCPNDKAVKGKVLFDVLKGRKDYDALVRVDLDAIVIQPDKLIDMIATNLSDNHAILGHVKKFRGRKPENKEFRGITYVRGPCNATSRSVIDQIDMDVSFKAGFDIPYAISFHKTKCKMINCKLYEDNRNYKEVLPVWHWHHKGLAKYDMFKNISNRYS